MDGGQMVLELMTNDGMNSDSDSEPNHDDADDADLLIETDAQVLAHREWASARSTTVGDVQAESAYQQHYQTGQRSNEQQDRQHKPLPLQQQLVIVESPNIRNLTLACLSTSNNVREDRG
jgi:hypothetical protein